MHLFQILLTGFSRERPLPTGGYEGACWVGCSSSDLEWGDSSSVDAEQFHQLRSALEKSVGIVGSEGCRCLLQRQGMLESLVAKAIVFLLLFFSPAKGALWPRGSLLVLECRRTQWQHQSPGLKHVHGVARTSGKGAGPVSKIAQ